MWDPWNQWRVCSERSHLKGKVNLSLQKASKNNLLEVLRCWWMKSCQPLHRYPLFTKFFVCRSWSLRWTTIKRMFVSERESFPFNAFRLQIDVRFSQSSPISPSFPTRTQGLLYECSIHCITEKMLADSLPSFIMIFHHPFPRNVFFCPNKKSFHWSIPNQLPNHPPDHTCSHRFELGRGPQPLHPRNHELVAIPRFGRVDALDCDDLWGPRQMWDIFFWGTERF